MASDPEQNMSLTIPHIKFTYLKLFVTFSSSQRVGKQGSKTEVKKLFSAGPGSKYFCLCQLSSSTVTPNSCGKINEQAVF